MPCVTIASPSIWRTYLVRFFSLSVVVLGGLAGMNYLLDPYLTHQWESAGVQRLRPADEKLSAWGKTYAMARLRPEVLFLGNSRTEIGLPAERAMFDGRRVFNGALSGASVGDAMAMAAYAARQGPLQTVVWGIDAPSFSLDHGALELTPELIADGPLFFVRRAWLDLQRGVTWDMTQDSIRLLRGRFGAICRSSLATLGQRDAACLTAQIARYGSSTAAMRAKLHEFAGASGPRAEALPGFEASLASLCRTGTRVRLYINPTHALTIDTLYWRGKWAAMETWQGALVELTQRLRASGCDLRLFDFSGFNSVTTEALPLPNRRQQMQNYWEASHYRASVGRLILARLFALPDTALPDDFGLELDQATLAAHLATLRSTRQRYHLEHAQESALAREISMAGLDMGRTAK